MRNLTNPDDLAAVILDSEEAVLAIVGDDQLKSTFKNGTYLQLILYLIRHHKNSLYAVVAALDGTIAAHEVPGHYSVAEIVALFRDLAKTDGIKEIVSFFVPAIRRNGAGSSGGSPANTAE